MFSLKPHILYTLIYFVLMSLILYNYYKNKKDFHISKFVFSLYWISALCSIIFVLHPNYDRNLISEIQFWPYIYWIILFGITCYPIIKYDKLGINKLKFNIKTINFICTCGLFISIEPFCESFLSISRLYGSSMSYIAIDDAHEEFNTIELSTIGYYLMAVVTRLELICTFSLIPLIISPGRKKIAIAGAVLVILTANMNGLACASRNSLLKTGLNLILVYLISYPWMTKQIFKQIRRYAMIVGTVILLLFSVITIARQFVSSEINEDNTMLFFLSQYAGEGVVNLNGNLPNLKKHSDGDFCFYAINDFLGKKRVDEDAVTHWAQISYELGAPMRIFYTYIGFFIIDLGFVGAFVFLTLLSIFITKNIKERNGEMNLSNLLIFFSYSLIIVNGICLYYYGGMKIYNLIPVFWFWVFLKYVQKT